VGVVVLMMPCTRGTKRCQQPSGDSRTRREIE